MAGSSEVGGLQEEMQKKKKKMKENVTLLLNG